MLEVAAENVPVSGGFDQDPMTMKVVGLEQRVPIFGGRALAQRAAEGDARAAQARVDDTRWQRLGDAWMAYADAYFAGTRAAAARDHQQVMDKMDVRQRGRATSPGRGRLDDLLRVEAERARIVADAVSFAAEARAARARLDALRGRDAGGADRGAGGTARVAGAGQRRGLARGGGGAPGRARARRARDGPARDGTRGAPHGVARADAARRIRLPRAARAGHVDARCGERRHVERRRVARAAAGRGQPPGCGGIRGPGHGRRGAVGTAGDDPGAGERDGGAARARRCRASHPGRCLTDTVLVAQRRALAAAWSAYEAGATDLARVFDAAHESYAQELETSRARQDLAGTLARLLAVTARPELVGVRVPAAGPEPQRRKP
jgi:hypothetical protein